MTGTSRKNLNLPAIDFSYTFDYAGRTTSTTWPSGAVVTSDYDASGLKLRDTVDGVAPQVSEYVDYEYDDRGLTVGWKSHNKVTLTAKFDSPNRLKSVVFEGMDTRTIKLTYRNNGWLATKGMPEINQTYSYGYDRLGRVSSIKNLFQAGAPEYENYQYDVGGNLEQMSRGTGSLYRKWTYSPVTRFGESGGRTSTTNVEDEHTWDPVTGRMTRWRQEVASTEVIDRHFSYDGTGRLVEIDDWQGGLTSLWYDVDDQLVYEERGGNDVYERFSGYRKSSTGTIESVLPFMRVETKPNGTQTLRYVMLDVDGHALFTFDQDGEELSRDVTGAYGLPLLGVNQGSSQTWEVDGLHGAEPDRTNEVTQFGVRHTLFRDGMWMQPEPLLGLSPGRLVDAPRMAGPHYAGGNPLIQRDTSGYYWESAWDIGNVVMGAGSCLSNLGEGNYGAAALDAVGVIADVAAVVTPLPGGAGTLIKAARAGDAVAGMAKAANAIDTAADVGKAAGAAADAGKAAGSGGDVTTLYRAVGPSELADIKDTGKLSAGPGMEGKWFADDAGGASQWGEKMDFGGKPTTIEADFPTSTAKEMFQVEKLDGIGPARYAEEAQLGACCAIRIPNE